MARRQQQAGDRGRSGAAGQGGRTRGQQQGQRSGQRQGFSPSRGGRPQGGYGARQQGRGGQRPQGRGSAGRSDLIEGRRAVEEALGAGVPLKSALVQIQSLDADPALERLAQRLDAAGVSVVHLRHGQSVAKGLALREQAAVLADEVVAGEDHVLRGLARAGAGVDVAAQQASALAAHQVTTVVGLADQGI